MPGEAHKLIERFWRIQDEGDYTKLAPLFAEDAVLDDPSWGRCEGRNAILTFMTTMVAEMTARDISFTVEEICGDQHTAWARWTMHSPDGNRGGVGIYKVRGGEVIYYRDYIDPPPEEG